MQAIQSKLYIQRKIKRRLSGQNKNAFAWPAFQRDKDIAALKTDGGCFCNKIGGHFGKLTICACEATPQAWHCSSAKLEEVFI